MTKVKICGITDLDDAVFGAESGADFLGFVFYKKSPRHVAPVRAAKIVEKLPPKVKKVGVFVNEDPAAVRRIADACRLDYLQFHGDEPPAYMKNFPGAKIIKAFRVAEPFSASSLKGFSRAVPLFDTFKKGLYGGTGDVFDWVLLKEIKRLRRKFFVSGGLTCDNVGALVAILHPYAVDVSSGVEKSAGLKDHRLVEKFIKAAKGA